jgi:hypothetical protein
VLSGYTAPLIVRAAGTDLDALEELQKLGAKRPQTTTAHSMLAGRPSHGYIDSSQIECWAAERLTCQTRPPRSRRPQHLQPTV